jgi:hypothetical protein
MVRPRASDGNVRIALAFADIVTIQTKPGICKVKFSIPVARKGRQSVFAAFAACFPNLARDANEKNPKNRRGVSLIEFNKAMQSMGLISVRKRDKVDGHIRWSTKVCCRIELCSMGKINLFNRLQFWSNCRWANPQDPRDLRIIADKLSRAQRSHAELNQCTLEQLLNILATLQIQSTDAAGGNSGLKSDRETSPHLSQNLITKQDGQGCIQLHQSLSSFGQSQPAALPACLHNSLPFSDNSQVRILLLFPSSSLRPSA